ncbi:saccharopine dehydrogenase-like NADP-dependent oxidoreductase [Leeuwenhoekiella aestuarii]|uniref:Saccharopine dehydrogenase-like NADP-dependent oxidoreductase n=1 Tax=Leeuwenhoekiella aestuarii TaxID=2249426 RepID=A0A4Q0P229_9FLAO|nr:saccharopine dehydrogenase family protein [Leeuwenhoekiella aestuarii]RXG18239.1 saccharopine dehydrogenase-like NADP-dependent oxidoreductase [Leeuwenhoekiella aestuarii]RXG19544.1 saccharopine dehydrogenase-like NADP-dependent oxidoreductase [Leeuwenhoekiella aestuarii]
MRNVLIIGAGKSTAQLIKYLAENAITEDLRLIVADKEFINATRLAKDWACIKAVQLAIADAEARQQLIKNAAIVISMLPAQLHIEIARDCLRFKKNMVTASYISEEMEALNKEVTANGLIFMNEIGLDPGIDHMSAMRVIDRIRDQGGKLLLFESFCGGLVAPESDDNLWNYKFTWNPRNVVLAGQGGAAEFIQEGTYKYIPYQRLFRRTEFLDVEGYGRFEAYANRNSLKYRSIYGLEDVLTLYRGTMRRVGFSRAWNLFVQLGMTDDSYVLQDTETMSYREFTNLFLPYSPTDSVQLKLRHMLKIDQDDLLWDKLLELNLFDKTKKIELRQATPAQCLQRILEDKWTLDHNDKDMIVMYHKFGYELNGEQKQIDSTMVSVGENQTYTAMAKTVGLPVGIAALKILNGVITNPGVQLPVSKEVYNPILDELETHGIIFKEYEVPYLGYNPHHE